MVRNGEIRKISVTLILIAGFAAAAAASVAIGRFPVSVKRVIPLLIHYLLGNVSDADSAAVTVLVMVRIPRICLASLVGADLAAAGAVYQGLFRNPMVAPDILGVSSGASVGAAFALLMGWSSVYVHISAFLCGFCVVIFIMVIAGRAEFRSQLLVMILAGVVVSSLCSALTSLIKYVADTDEKLPAITFWLMGSFAKNSNAQNVWLMLAVTAVGIIPLLLLRWQINAMSFGEDQALSLGIDVKKTRAVIILCSTLMTASSVCICGMIGWVGLVIPHIMRFLVGSNFKDLLPDCILGGAVFMLITDDISRVILPGELPIGILTSLVGAPLFIYLLLRRKEVRE